LRPSEIHRSESEDAVYGSGISLFLGIPMLIMLNIPIVMFNNSMNGYWITLGLLIAYMAILWILWRAIGFIKFRKPKV